MHAAKVQRGLLSVASKYKLCISTNTLPDNLASMFSRFLENHKDETKSEKKSLISEDAQGNKHLLAIGIPLERGRALSIRS